MTPELWQRVKAVFDGALDLPAEDRPAFLDAACDGDDELRREVDSLLEASGRSDLLERPAVGVRDAIERVAVSEAVESGTRDRVCPRCGAQFPPEARFCRVDGEPLEEVEAESTALDLAGRAVTAPEPSERATAEMLPPRHNLPSQSTVFVDGRGAVGRVTRELAQARLVTLVGPGGIGKTRLALEAAGRVLYDFPDGVWLVELAGVTDGSLVAKAAAAALSVHEEVGRSVTQSVCAALAAKTALLVLDNCEHVVAAAAAFAAAVLRSCPDVRLLASSREPLGAAGESVWSVPSLPVPAKGETSLDALGDVEAVRLFVDRARLSRAGFALAPSNAPAVAEVCRRLEGIPLAIELAAARVAVLSVEQILDRLADRFRLLTDTGRTREPRHQTLRATIDWSFDQLAPDERVLLRRLAIFAGSWSLSAAEYVCSQPVLEPVAPTEPLDDRGLHRTAMPLELARLATRLETRVLTAEIEPEDVLDTLSRLVAKSFVVADTERDEARYSMFETVREYAREKLAAAGETAEVSTRLVEWALGLTDDLNAVIATPKQPEHVARMRAEVDNLRAALELCATIAAPPQGPSLLLRLCAALGPFWRSAGFYAEGRAWLARALSDRSSSPERARALTRAAMLAIDQGDHDEGRDMLEEALGIARAVGDRASAAYALRVLGFAHMRLGEEDRAVALIEESLQIARELGDRAGVASSCFVVASVALGRGDLDLAETLLAESVATTRALGTERNMATSLYTLASVAMLKGDLARAGRLLDESFAIVKRFDERQQIAYVRYHAANLACARGEFDLALETFRDVLREVRDMGDAFAVLVVLEGIAWALAELGDAAGALRLAGAAETARREQKRPQSDFERACLARRLAPARLALADPTAANAFEEGRGLRVEQAVAIALGAARA